MAEEEWKRVSVRLSEEADNLLRLVSRRKGDLGEALRKAILNTDWEKVQLAKRRKTFQRFWRTSFTINAPVYEKLKESARKRGVEVGVLIDAIIVSYYFPPEGEQ
jgi:predicted RNA-binding protein YlxR (DUF448 family)